MATIAWAGNSDTACLQCVLEKGYKVTCYFEDTGGEDDFYTYLAEKDEESFSGRNGMELLGLITLWENYKDSWQDLLKKCPYDKINYDN